MAEAQRVEGEKFVFPDEAKKDEASPETELEISVEGETDIEVIDDVPERDRGHKPGVSKDVEEVTDEELAAYSGNVQKRIKELSFSRHDERRAKEAAVREREEMEKLTRAVFEENQKLKQYVHNGEQVYVGTAKAAAAAKLEMAKNHYKAAHEAFDADALVAAQQELTAAQLEIVAAENFRPVALTTQQMPQYSQPTEQVRPDSRAEDWQQRNRWFGDNKRMTALALAVHQELVETGVDPRSDEYYKRIDAGVRETFPKYFGDEGSSAGNATPHRRPASVVAPTSRSSSAKKISLTQTQVNLARKFGLTNEQYASQVALLETNNGR